MQHHESTIISRKQGTVLVDLIAYPPKRTGLEKPTFWVRCLHLSVNSPCFEDLPLNLTPAFAPEITAISDDLKTVAVGPLATAQAPTKKDHISIYSTASKELLRNIDIPPVMAKRRLTGLALTRNAGLLIGAFKGETKTDKGGLVAWEVSTGRALQIILGAPVLRLNLSASGRTLLSVTEHEIQQYALRY